MSSISHICVVDGVHQDEIPENILAPCWLTGEQGMGAAARAASHSGGVWVEELTWGQV